MTKIYENDERDKLLPISITINFILRTMFLFIIKRWLYLVFYRLKIQIAWGASLVKKPRPIDADIYQFKLLLRGSAILYSEFNMFIHFFPTRWAMSIFQWSCLSKLQLHGKEKLSEKEILTDDLQMIKHCIEIDVEIKWGEVDVFWYQAWNFTKNIVNFTFNSQ